jgi:hypothetical protein
MWLLRAGTVLLSPALGVLALAPFAVIAILPQTALTYAARTRPVARLKPEVATRRYPQALGVQLGLPRVERRRFVGVLAPAHRRRPTGDPIDYATATMAYPSSANLEAPPNGSTAAAGRLAWNARTSRSAHESPPSRTRGPA